MSERLVRFDDLLKIVEKIRQGYLSRMPVLLLPESRRVESVWSQTTRPPRHWGAIPEVRARWNRAVSGDPDVGLQEHVAHRYTDRSGLAALSLACGSGAGAIRWAQTGVFGRIDAFDASMPRIQSAVMRARESEVDSILDFHVDSFEDIRTDPDRYDVVIADNALHRASDLDSVLDRLVVAMKPGAILVLRDYVGPSRFQWTDEQVAACDELLRRLPVRYRRRWMSNSVKKRVHRTGTLLMKWTDPSAAAHSSEIPEAVERRLSVVETRPLGGTILHPVFDDIAHHFLDENPETRQLLEMCFRFEDELLEANELPSDFRYGLYRKD